MYLRDVIYDRLSAKEHSSITFRSAMTMLKIYLGDAHIILKEYDSIAASYTYALDANIPYALALPHIECDRLYKHSGLMAKFKFGALVVHGLACLIGAVIAMAIG